MKSLPIRMEKNPILIRSGCWKNKWSMEISWSVYPYAYITYSLTLARVVGRLCRCWSPDQQLFQCDENILILYISIIHRFLIIPFAFYQLPFLCRCWSPDQQLFQCDENILILYISIIHRFLIIPFAFYQLPFFRIHFITSISFIQSAILHYIFNGVGITYI